MTHIESSHLFANLYYRVRKSQAGKGIAPAAVPQLAQFAFKTGLQRVEIVVATGNAPSLRVAEKVGAVREGLLRNRIRVGSQVHDAIMFSLIPNDLNSRGAS